MSYRLVLTVLGDDRPGLVGELASVISAHHGNWLQSSMAQLAGKFAGIVEVSVSGDHLDGLTQALSKLTTLKVTVESTEVRKSALARRRLRKKLRNKI